MVDRRIVPDLRWIAARYPIYVTDGYSGPLPDGEHVGCNNCHVSATPTTTTASPSTSCRWTRAAHATAAGRRSPASPTGPSRSRTSPRAPFRWVGYDGDAGHGCGNHLHLSWEHAAAPMFQLAEWVEVFPIGPQAVAQQPQPSGPPPGSTRSAGVKPPKGPQGGSEAETAPIYQSGPSGGVSVVQSGGVSTQSG